MNKKYNFKSQSQMFWKASISIGVLLILLCSTQTTSEELSVGNQAIDEQNNDSLMWIIEVNKATQCDVAYQEFENYFEGSLNTRVIGQLKSRMNCFISVSSDYLDANSLLDQFSWIEEIHADQVVQTHILSNLDRIDQFQQPLDNLNWDLEYDGSGVVIYIVDTGVYIDHGSFGGRVSFGWSYSNVTTDENGHGTHVAGTALADTYGVARGATGIAVKVGGASITFPSSNLIGGLQWVIEQTYGSDKTNVVNLSVGSDYSKSINSLVEDVIEAGNIVVVAAGNDAADACCSSPGTANGVINVGALARDSAGNDYGASFSNYGSCVDIWAPGQAITSTYKSGGTAVMSGTSMAAPLVSGVMATYLQKYNFDKQAALDELTAFSSKGTSGDPDWFELNIFSVVRVQRAGEIWTPTPQPTLSPLYQSVKMCSAEDTCFDFASSSFGPEIAPGVEGVYAQTILPNGDETLCDSSGQKNGFSGKIVVVKRGGCDFFNKVKLAEAKGAVAVVIRLINATNSIFNPTYYGNEDVPTIPSAIISYNDGETIVNNYLGQKLWWAPGGYPD